MRQVYIEYAECGKKWRHFDVLSAIAHAKHLTSIKPDIVWETYICNHCNWLHVGRNKQRSKVIRKLKERLANPNFIAKAPPEIVESTRQRLEKFATQYGSIGKRIPLDTNVASSQED